VPEASPDRVFFLCVATAIPLEVVAFVCYMKAIRLSPLSLSLPFLAFTPVFLISTGWIILGEIPGPGGTVGVLLVVVGSYCLHLPKIAGGVLGPIKAVWSEPGSRLMLGVAMIYSITAPLGKLAILHSNPLYFGCVYFTALPLAMLLLLPFQLNREGKGRIIASPKTGLPVGLAMAVMIISHIIAMNLIEAVYVITLKRTSLLFAIFYGAFWFKEERFRERLAGVVIMLAGIVLIGWRG
jgi:drug/metabolite transporter (DMT)-like permease